MKAFFLNILHARLGRLGKMHTYGLENFTAYFFEKFPSNIFKIIVEKWKITLFDFLTFDSAGICAKYLT